jgi:threonine synthase
MRGKRGIRVFMLSPHGRMSPFQQAQMFSLQDENIHNLAVEGVFDDCQDIVKAVSNDLTFKRRHRIGTVNSINWARLVAQVVYYVAAWLQATKADDEVVDFCVPSGNFGNICAGHVARRMGLPIGRLVCATNENDVLDEFFRTGATARAPRRKRTRPPARRWTSPRPATSSASSSTCSAATAQQRRSGVPMLVLETALPAKFEETMVEAIGQTPPRPAHLAGIERLPKRVTVIDKDEAAVRAFIDAHVDPC